MTDPSGYGIIVVRDQIKVEGPGDPDKEWVHVQLAADKWAMVRVGGDTIATRREKTLGDIEFEIERLKANGEFAE